MADRANAGSTAGGGSGEPVVGFADVPGGRLHYELRGRGEPVVLLHGFSFDLRMWDEQVEALARSRRVLRYDLRGFGRSSLPAGDYSHVEDLQALLDHLGLPRVDLVGLSLGGGLALDFALTSPHSVASLALLDSTLGGFAWGETGAAMDEAWAVGKRAGIEAARAAWLAGPLFAPALARPDLAPRLRRFVGEYSGWHWVNRNPLRPLRPPAAQRLGELRAPTLVLVGEHDGSDFHEIARTLAHEVTGARLDVLPGVGHMANLEAPELVNDRLASFLAAPRP